MSRLFWFTVGLAVGAAGYRFVREQGGFESLGQPGRRLQDSAQMFADASRELAQASREFAHTAVDLAQMRSQEVVNRGQEVVNRGQDVVSTVKEQASRVAADPRGTVRSKLREDVKADVSRATTES